MNAAVPAAAWAGAGGVPLHADRLSLDLGGRRVLHELSCALRPGCLTAIVGPNGAGKSSLLMLLAGLRAPAAGTVRLGERALASFSARDRARRIAWLSQQAEVEGDIAAADVVALGRLPHHGLLGTVDAADHAAVQAAMHDMACSAFAARRLNELSGGERQRVLLARVFAAQAPLLLLDEPTTHLDAPHQRLLMRQLAARAVAGAAVVVVLHDLTQALAADHLLVLAEGRLVAEGPPCDAALRAAIVEVFGHCFTIDALRQEGRERWVAVPRR